MPRGVGAFVRVVGVVLLVVVVGCGPGPEGLASLRVEVPASVAVGGSVSVTVTAVGVRGSDPLTSFSGSVSLSVDDGSVAPGSVALVGGVGTVQVTLGGVVGPVTLLAEAGSVVGSAVVELLPLAALPGAAGDAAASALPFVGYRQRSQDYAFGAPDLPGLELSFNTVTLILEAAATVGAVNDLIVRFGAVVVGFVPGIPGSHGAILVLRLSTADHVAMLVALAALGVEPLVKNVHRESWPPALVPVESVEPAGVGSLALPTHGAGTLAGWTWERMDQVQPTPDANWGLEFVRAPQLWNLNVLAQAGAGALTGVLDGGFPDHPDLSFHERLGVFADPVLASLANDHGLHVTGIIAAVFDNGVGVDGVNPFARVVAKRFGAGLSWGMVDFIVERPSLRVVNASLGHNWYQRTPAIDPNSDEAAQQQATAEGLTFAHFLDTRRATSPVPLVVASAGNDSERSIGTTIDARWGSPFAAAALIHGELDIIVVEAVGRSGAGVSAADFSNAGGHVSAPGVDIWSASASASYRSMDGTSMAAPHVSGLAGFLLALEPGLSNAQLRSAIVGSASSVIGSAPLVDAFAAALELDVAFGGPRVVRALVDVDDGTLDGNLRVDLATGAPVFGAMGFFGPEGDGTVDMRDFRRWRDALLAVENAAGLDLDGAADHPARDLNLDGVVGTPAQENVFSRFDFNGDGRVDRTAKAFVGGLFGAELTDLEVLMAVWGDPDVEASALIDLIDSGDLHVDGDDAFLDPEVSDVEVTLTPRGGGAPTVLSLAGASSRVLTLPVGTYDVETRFFGGGLLALHEREVTITLGGDRRLVPSAVALAPLDVTLDTGDVESFTAKAYGFADSRVTWTATGGTITDAGRYTAGGTPGTYGVTARSLVDPSVRSTARVRVRDDEDDEDDTSPGVGIEFRKRGGAHIAELYAVAIGVYDGVRRYYNHTAEDVDDFDTGPFQAVVARSGAYGPGGISSSARGEVDETLQFTDRFKGFTHTFGFRVQASALSGGADKKAVAGTGITGCFLFDVTGKPARFSFDMTVTSNDFVVVGVSLSSHSPDDFDEELLGAGSFAATGELLANESVSLCYSIEAVAEAERPAQVWNYPPLVEGSVTMSLSLSQP